MGSAHRIEAAGQLIGRAVERIHLEAERAVERAAAQVSEVWSSINQAAGIWVERQAAAIDRVAQAVALQAVRRVDRAASEADRERERAVRAVGHQIALAAGRLDDAAIQATRAADAMRRDAGMRIEFFVRRIVGLGPEATLRRGYAIVRDDTGRPLGTRGQAEAEPALELEFQDGRLRVENRAAARGSGT